MIRLYDDAPPRSPQQALADALNGTILGPSTIRVGAHLVTTSPLGVVRVGRHPLGLWRDETAALVAAFRAVSAA